MLLQLAFLEIFGFLSDSENVFVESRKTTIYTWNKRGLPVACTVPHHMVFFCWVLKFEVLKKDVLALWPPWEVFENIVTLPEKTQFFLSHTEVTKVGSRILTKTGGRSLGRKKRVAVWGAGPSISLYNNESFHYHLEFISQINSRVANMDENTWTSAWFLVHQRAIRYQPWHKVSGIILLAGMHSNFPQTW